MGKFMKHNWLKHLLNQGVGPDTEISLVKNIRVFNTLYWIVLITEISVIPLALIFFQYAWPVLIICGVMILLVVISLHLNATKKHLAASILGALAAVNNITWFTILLGTQTNVHFLMPAIMIGAFYYFPYEKKNIMLFITFISLGAFVFLEIWFRHHVPVIQLPDAILWIARAFVDVMFAVITFGFMFYGFKIYRESEESLKLSRMRLAERNEILENEIEMARRIQAQIIPSVSPDPRIAFCYHPMEKVGGDFFDFIHFPGKVKTGIFLSDVSGHGVPAAFITSMIKSTLLQIAVQVEDPAMVLRHLNATLYGQTGGNFVTAFYGIYNWNTRSLIYSNAGHNLPYIIRKGKVENLPSLHTCPPLFVLQNQELDLLGKLYYSDSCSLEQESKVLFYTDGLTEAVNEAASSKHLTDTPDFESGGLLEGLKELEKQGSAAFIGGLYSRLKEYRGSENFEDDVCMISLDIN